MYMSEKYKHQPCLCTLQVASSDVYVREVQARHQLHLCTLLHYVSTWDRHACTDTAGDGTEMTTRWQDWKTGTCKRGRSKKQTVTRERRPLPGGAVPQRSRPVRHMEGVHQHPQQPHQQQPPRSPLRRHWRSNIEDDGGEEDDRKCLRRGDGTTAHRITNRPISRRMWCGCCNRPVPRQHHGDVKVVTG